MTSVTMPPAATLRVVAVGDIMLGDSAIVVGFGAGARYQDPNTLLAGLEDFSGWCRDADLVFGNLETPLSDHGLDRASWRTRQMRGRPEHADALRRCGFTVLNVANNHATQHDRAGFDDTVGALNAAGIEPCGLRGDAPWCAKPVIVARNRLRIGIVGYCLRPRQYGADEPPYAEGTVEQICADVTRLRADVHHVVVSLHWGEEFVEQPARSEVAAARRIAGAGARLILGHHPHVVRPIESRGGVVTAFSLGNFLSDMTWDEALRRGAVLECRLGASGATPTRVRAVYTSADYVPSARPDGGFASILRPEVSGIDDTEYARLVSRTVRRVRIAGYRHALRSLGRYEVGILAQLVLNTVRNRVAALVP